MGEAKRRETAMKHFMVGAAAAAILSGATVASAQEHSIRVGSFTPEGAVGVQNVMIPWMEAVRDELGDRVDLTGFWGGTLGPDPFAQYELVRDGVIDVAWILPGYTPGQFPQLQITELPFTVQSGEEASTVAWRLYETGLLDGFDDVHVLSIWTPDITNIHLTEPVENLGDLEGSALRTAGATQALFVEAIEAAPQTLGSVEANEAMLRGTIDGQLQGWTGMRTFGGFAVADATYMVPLGASPFLLLMNLDTWNGLPEDVQEVMMRHAGEGLGAYGGSRYDAITQDIIATQRDEGHTIIEASQDDIAAYADQYSDVHDRWIEQHDNGQEIYDTFIQLLNDYRSGG